MRVSLMTFSPIVAMLAQRCSDCLWKDLLLTWHNFCRALLRIVGGLNFMLHGLSG
ncbi:hypothetical protein [Stenotrophomonas geniculata]|uniref:hypothetical protein n=1 Tax=Stenotrophomonas geniculata TaxID=86188 RepID=UPI003CE59EA4